MTFDVLNHLRDLAENLGDWETYVRETSERRFLTDRKARHALLHAVLVALQAAIDIGNHWVTGLTPQRPESYRGVAELLEESGALPPALAKDLKGLFALRNILVHKYQALDVKLLYRHLKAGVRPLSAFLKLAKAQVGRKESRRRAIPRDRRFVRVPRRLSE